MADDAEREKINTFRPESESGNHTCYFWRLSSHLGGGSLQLAFWVVRVMSA